MKKITKILFALIMIMALSFSLMSFAFAEGTAEESVPADQSEESMDSEVTNDPTYAGGALDDMNDGTEDDSDSETGNESSYASTGSTITLQARNQTLKQGEVFGTSYSTAQGGLVIAYDYVLYDANGNVSDGSAPGTYTITIQNVRVYAPDDTTFSNDIAGDYTIDTINGTLTRTGTGTSYSSSTTNGTSTSGTTSSTTSVKTGDENNIGLWVAISVIALAGVSASVVMIRRKASK